MDQAPLLAVSNLHVRFRQRSEEIHAVKGLEFSVNPGQTLGIVGESGSGKSVSSLAVMRLLSGQAVVSADSIQFQPSDGVSKNLLSLTEDEMTQLRGNQLAMIFQEPMTSLNPVHKCGKQVQEAIMLHQRIGRKAAKAQTLDWFGRVNLPRPAQLFDAYPHEISGGQKQRVMIAMAMCCHPQLLIADEPTTALDVTVQRTILDLMQDLQAEFGMGMMFISHDLGVVGELADQILVMYRGEQVEYGITEQIFTNPQHPYTTGLLACRPQANQSLRRLPTLADFLKASEAKAFSPQVKPIEEVQQRMDMLAAKPPLVEVEGLKTYFPVRNGLLGRPKEVVKAVDDVSLKIYPGETLGLVGESGCGKTTLGRTIVRLTDLTEGVIHYQGKNVAHLTGPSLRAWRKEAQLIFQDPYSSLNPKMTIGQAIAEPLKVHGLAPNASERNDRVAYLLKKVGLSADHMKRYPREFSGGQRQRICIARALAVSPQFIVCDESVSALDVSVQAVVLNLLKDLQDEMGLTYLFISHDLSVVRFISDRILVMKSGKIVESGTAQEIYENPQAPYTQSLLGAIPAANWSEMERRKRERTQQTFPTSEA